jgi:suppressor of G2 allele of SKP1
MTAFAPNLTLSTMATLRHEFYETDERLTLSIFDRGADPEQVVVKFDHRKVSYQNGEKTLVLEPLKGQIDPNTSDFTVGKVKVEIRLAKKAHGRWGGLVGDSPDPLSTTPFSAPAPAPSSSTRKPSHKNWDGITTEILSSEKEKTTEQDPNVGGDSTLNSFFQKIFGDADDDTKRAMMKSYQESGGTTLSTNWDEVKKAPVTVKPPAGSEYKKWN